MSELRRALAYGAQLGSVQVLGHVRENAPEGCVCRNDEVLGMRGFFVDPVAETEGPRPGAVYAFQPRGR